MEPARSMEPASSSRLAVVVVGDLKTGKTSIVQHLCGKGFNRCYKATIGADVFDVKHTMTPLQIWDMSGNQSGQYDCLTEIVKVARGAMIVFDATRPEMLESVRSWKSRLDGIKQLPTIVCGNKTDVMSTVMPEGYFSVSAKDNVGIAEALDALVLKMLDTSTNE